jgi:steroid delta-isomerase-like uncharacterized protein
MSTHTEQNKAIVRYLEEANNSEATATTDELLAPDFVLHMSGMPDPLNRESVIQLAAAWRSSFSNTRHEFEDQIAEDDKVVSRFTWHAVHTGEFQGMPATGKQIAVPGIYIDHVRDGQVVERWASLDSLGMMQQLGLMPSQADQ